MLMRDFYCYFALSESIMRDAYIVGSLLLLCFSCSGGKTGGNGLAVENGTDQKADIKFEKLEHDLGTVVQGETVGYNFAFTNSGNASLIIQDAGASCGCTVPRYSKEPVPPGGSGTVEVVFDTSGRIGQQSKTVTIRTNGKVPVTCLTIKANIIEPNS